MVTRLLEEEETPQDGALREFAAYSPLPEDESRRVRERHRDVLDSVRGSSGAGWEL